MSKFGGRSLMVCLLGAVALILGLALTGNPSTLSEQGSAKSACAKPCAATASTAAPSACMDKSGTQAAAVGHEAQAGAKCSSPQAKIACSESATLAEGTSYSKDDLKVIAAICDQIVARKSIAIDPAIVEKATGLSMEANPPSYWQAGVLAELNRREFDVETLMANSHCTKFRACSINQDLAYATGPELARYQREIEEDGARFSGVNAHDFQLPSTAGAPLQLSAFRNKKVVVTFLAVHCNHSWDTLPILETLAQKYKDVVFLPVYSNSGSVEDVRQSTAHLKLKLNLAVAEDKGLSQAYDSLMVPSTFLIGEDGQLQQKFVGFKEQAFLDSAIAGFAKEASAAKISKGAP